MNHVGTQYTRIHWPPGYPELRPQREEELEFQELPTPTCPKFLFVQKSNTDHQLIFLRENFETCCSCPTTRGAQIFFWEVIKEKEDLEHLEGTNFFFWFAQLRIIPASKLASAHPCGLRHRRKWILVTIALKKGDAVKMHISKTNYTGYPAVFGNWKHQHQHTVVLL